MSSPLFWQLRLHRFLPVALLWCAVALGVWMFWMDQPARWLGTDPGVASLSDWRTPEQTVLSMGQIVAWIIALGLALWWLLRVRIHNRWRERAPASRLGVWWEYLWGAAFFCLVFAPALLMETVYQQTLQRTWSAMPGVSVPASIQAARHVNSLELLVDPRNAVHLIEWTQALPFADDGPPQREDNTALHALRWLVQGDTQAIAQVLKVYGDALQSVGYAHKGADSAQQQAGQLLAAYQASLNSPLAQEWRAYKAQHQGTPTDDQRNCLEVQHGSATPRIDPQSCFDIYLSMPAEKWLRMLSVADNGKKDLPSVVQWTHVRYGVALPRLLQAHLSQVETDVWRQRAALLQAMSFGFFAALALVAIRLMSPMQLTAWLAGLVLAFPCYMLLGMLGHERFLWAIPTVLVATAWVRIGALRRPWAGSLFLGLGMVLSVVAMPQLWSGWGYQVEHCLRLQAGCTNAQRWLGILMGTPAIAASCVVMVAVLSPLWRRWRGLSEI